MKFANILTSIVLGALLGALPAAPAVAAKGDDVLLDMASAFQKGQSRRLTELLAQAQGHVLEPWAAYWELRARLESAGPEEIEAFFQRYRGSYQEDRLRNDWLLLLGQRRDWTRFALALPAFRMNDDHEVRCYALAMALSQGASPQPDALKTQWYAQRDTGAGCALTAQAYHEAGHLKAPDIWHKARLAVDARQQKAARLALAIVAPGAEGALTQLLANPERYLAAAPASAQPLQQELAVLALTRLADTSAERAASEMEKHWSRHLTEAQRAWVWGAIGKDAAQSLSEDALGYFQKSAAQGMADPHLVWRARAALRRGQWGDALASINAMSAEAAAQPAWVYWRARALLQPGHTPAEQAQARQTLQAIAGVRGFYEMLAQEALGLPVTPPPPPEPLTISEREAARTNPGLQRALAAIALGLRPEGVREWNYSTNLHNDGGMNDRELLAAADLACQNEVWDRCINTSERTRGVIDLTQRFPMPHRKEVLARSREIGLDPAYVYGLIRQESRFIMDARSGVGASGLMQVMPATAKWTAKKIGLSDFKPHQITERDTNIAIGTGYLKLVLDDFAGSMPLAAAAYNAGPGRPRNWRGGTGAPVLEAAIWAENIPFTETRDYVKKVLANTTVYAAMISGQTQSLLARLGRIGPRDAKAGSENRELP